MAARDRCGRCGAKIFEETTCASAVKCGSLNAGSLEPLQQSLTFEASPCCKPGHRSTMRIAQGAHPQRGKPSPEFLPAKAYTSTAMPMLHSQVGRSVLLPQAPELACRQPAPCLLAQKLSALTEHSSNGMLPPCSGAQDHRHLQCNNQYASTYASPQQVYEVHLHIPEPPMQLRVQPTRFEMKVRRDLAPLGCMKADQVTKRAIRMPTQKALVQFHPRQRFRTRLCLGYLSHNRGQRNT